MSKDISQPTAQFYRTQLQSLVQFRQQRQRTLNRSLPEEEAAIQADLLSLDKQIVELQQQIPQLRSDADAFVDVLKPFASILHSVANSRLHFSTLQVGSQSIPIIDREPSLLIHGLDDPALHLSPKDELGRMLGENDCVVLLGVSGCGKTRTSFELLSDQIGLYFSCGSLGSADIMAACRMIETIARETENPSHPMFVSKEEDRLESLNRLARHVFQALILSRLIVLEGIRNILPDLTPLCAHQWLLLQIFPSLGEAQIGIRKGRDLFLDVFNGTAIRFRNADLSFNFADLESELRGRLERVCRTYAVEHVLMVVDEAQILTHTMAQSFPSSSPTHSQRRPIITPLTTTCRSLESICLVYSGTGLLLSTLEKHIASAVLKSSSRIPTYVNFPCYDTFEKMRSFVNDRYKIGAADADIEYALSKLKGRARLLASCVESVLQKDSTLPEAVDSVFEAATDATRLGETSLVGQLDRIDTGKRPSFVKGINVGALLGRVIMSAQYFGDSPMFTGEHERFFVEVGFCRLKSYQSTLVAILDEPAAIVAGLKWLEKHAEERSDNTFQSTVTRMLAVMKGSPSTCGFLFEYFLLPVLPKIFNLVPVHPLLSNIDDLPARYTLPATLRNAGRYPIITRSSDKYTLKEWLEDSLVGKGSPFFRPEEPAGPDLVFVVENTNGLVIVFLQAKFGPGFTTMTMDTINPERFYHSRDTKPTILPHLKKRAKAVATLLKDHFGRDKRVVRMLTIFPLATPQHIYSHVVEAVPPEKRRTRAQRKAKDMPPDLILVVDKENMDEMVTAEHREFLEILQKLDQKGVK